jgi:hypothetical protein
MKWDANEGRFHEDLVMFPRDDLHNHQNKNIWNGAVYSNKKITDNLCRICVSTCSTPVSCLADFWSWRCGDNFLRNVGLHTGYTALYSRTGQYSRVIYVPRLLTVFAINGREGARNIYAMRTFPKLLQQPISNREKYEQDLRSNCFDHRQGQELKYSVILLGLPQLDRFVSS